MFRLRPLKPKPATLSMQTILRPTQSKGCSACSK